MEKDKRQKYMPWLEFFYQVGAIIFYAILSTLIWIAIVIITVAVIIIGVYCFTREKSTPELMTLKLFTQKA